MVAGLSNIFPAWFLLQEFEIIAQIKLLQEAAKNYFILPDAKVREWFHNIATFTEADR